MLYSINVSYCHRLLKHMMLYTSKTVSLVTNNRTKTKSMQDNYFMVFVMSGLYRLLSFIFLILGVFGLVGSLYLFGLKAVTTSLTRDMIGNAIWRVADSNMTAYEGIEVMNEWLNELSSLSDKMLLFLLIYSLVLTVMSIMIIKAAMK